ncbi:hypothetical protein BDR04DRAFT_1233987 [Suillus decipiens]|nr:hypothetical protein BDR04DRAFT_1233987 [Suillus decipiens]
MSHRAHDSPSPPNYIHAPLAPAVLLVTFAKLEQQHLLLVYYDTGRKEGCQLLVTPWKVVLTFQAEYESHCVG